MKYIRGFLMAWGCFCWIPCPYKKWNEEDRPAMLAMLPIVGTFIGVITGLVWLALSLMGAGPMLTAVIVTAAYFLLTGFIHLDGYMDCCDAILPRHPDMERRREILKDPHNGAFGIISLVIMMAIFIASAAELSETHPLKIVVVFSIITTVSRMDAVISVLSKEPMDSSQYSDIRSGKGSRLYIGIPSLIGVLVFMAGDWILKEQALENLEVVGDSVVVDIPLMVIPLVAALVVLIAGEITGAYDRKVLGGMNGDISGHMIVTGEMFGMLAAALLV